ncbi:unnamed protein product [Caenorhabditis brenneri]
MSQKDNKGVIRFQIDNFAELKTDQEYKPVEIGNAEWIFGAFSSTSDATNNVKSLGVYLKCNNSMKSNLWSCDASIQFSIVKLNSNDKNEKFSADFSHKFDGKSKKFEVKMFKNWEEVNCYDNRFVFDKHAVLECQVTVNKVVGIHEKILETFEKPIDNLADVVLIVEGKKCHVAKQLLAIHSEHFKAMFYGGFEENSKKEIVIEAVAYDEFVDLLNLIYPTHKTVDKSNVDHLLKLADRFHVPRVIEEAERFLISDKETHLVDKLKLAEIYKLSKLQDQCLSELKTQADVLALEKHANYGSLGDITYNVLLQKLVDILNGR